MHNVLFLRPEGKVEWAFFLLFLAVLLTFLLVVSFLDSWRQRQQGKPDLPPRSRGLLRRLGSWKPTSQEKPGLPAGCFLFLLAMVSLLTSIAIWLLLSPDSPQPRTQEQAVAAIQSLQGEITRDETKPGKPVVKVSFRDSMFRRDSLFGRRGLDDADLPGLEPDLQALTELRDLDLVRANITDKGLPYLKSLTHLKTLQLGSRWSFGSNLTRRAVDELRQALPQTEIYFYEPDIPIGIGPLPALPNK